VLSAGGVERRWGDDGLLVAIERLVLRPGEVVALVGPSGCGKSTVLDLLAFTLRPDRAGRFALGEAGGAVHDVAALWRRGAGASLTDLRARLIGYVLQTAGLLPYLSAFENAMLGRHLLGLGGPGELPSLFAALGLTALTRRMPAELSIGERQRVAVARALAHRPHLLLADEPTAALDPATARETIALLVDLARRTGSATVIVSHDHDLVAAAGCRIIACRIDPGRTTVSDIDSPP
jgi:putative ABC transport system ATP-binding protein